ANPDIEIREFKTLEDQVDRSLTRERLLSKLTSVFGLLALALAGSGLYGILSYAVVRRTQEIGIRLALGARAAEVRRMLLRVALSLLPLRCRISGPDISSSDRFADGCFSCAPVRTRLHWYPNRAAAAAVWRQ